MRLLKVSLCRYCGASIKYEGKGRPKQICDECRKGVYAKERRLKENARLRIYRRKLRMFLNEHGWCGTVLPPSKKVLEILDQRKIQLRCPHPKWKLHFNEDCKVPEYKVCVKCGRRESVCRHKWFYPGGVKKCGLCGKTADLLTRCYQFRSVPAKEFYSKGFPRE